MNKEHPRHVLVTGGAGYIGSHVVRDLGEAGYVPIVVDNLSSGNAEHILYGSMEIADIDDCKKIAELIRRYKIKSVLHFAAFIQVEESVKNPTKYYENNSWKAFRFIRCCQDNGIQNFVFSSTAAIYGIPRSVPVAETAPLAPINPYGTSKMFTELMLRDLAASNPDFNYIALRYFNVAGADRKKRIGQKYGVPTHLITLALKAALGTVPELKIFGTDYPTEDGTAVRDYIDMDDIARAHILALRFLCENKKSLVLNCGYGQGYSVRQVVEAVKKITGTDFPVKETGRRAGDPPVLVADSAKIKQLLGWKPQFDNLDRIISAAWDWEKKIALQGGINDIHT